jgi:hypothetical protein
MVAALTIDDDGHTQMFVRNGRCTPPASAAVLALVPDSPRPQVNVRVRREPAGGGGIVRQIIDTEPDVAGSNSVHYRLRHHYRSRLAARRR